MKKLSTLLFILLFCYFHGSSQIFWSENFESGSTGGALATSYGGWTVTYLTPPSPYGNIWYVSCAENGHTAGICGTGCVAASATATGATLHIGAASIWGGDGGASYFAGGIGDATTNARAQSPTINCTGKYGITLAFYYIEDGDGTNDNATVSYSADGGTTWSLLVDVAKTPTATCSPQGEWTHYSIALPASANNNANVKIGFTWINNNDGTGTDPSFAVDSMSLRSTTSATLPVAALTYAPNDTVCQDSCITFTNTSTGTVDSIKWIVSPGATTPPFPTVNPFVLCLPAAGTYTVALMAFGGGGYDTATAVINVKQSPHPTITKAGHVLTVSGTGYTGYQWYNNTTLIAGATNNTYTYTGSGVFTVRVDSNGCRGTSNTINTVGVAQLNNTNSYWIAGSDYNYITLRSDQPIDDPLHVIVADPTGRIIARDTWNAGDNIKQLSVADLPPGLYIIRLSSDSFTTVLKLLQH